MIDLHAHVVLDESMGAAGPQCGPELGVNDDGSPFFRVGDWRLEGVPYRNSLFMDVDVRLAAMDEAGITTQALSPNPLSYLHHIDAANATEYCQRHNDALATLTNEHPDRLLGFASLPMQDVDAAARELERCMRDLGLLGGYIGTDFGMHVDDLAMDTLYAACVEVDAPLFIHPAPTGLDGPLRDPRMAKYDLELVIEFSYEELITVAMLVFGGVTERHPDLDLCISHAGGSTPMHLAKLRALAERRKATPEWLREPGAFDRAFSRLWFDCHVSGPAEFAFAVEQLGTERLVFGTNFGGWDKAEQASSQTSGVHELADVLNDNARRLVRRPDLAK